MALAWDPLVPLILTALALIGSGIIIWRSPNQSTTWKVDVVVRALALVVAVMVILTILDLIIPGPPFVLFM